MRVMAGTNSREAPENARNMDFSDRNIKRAGLAEERRGASAPSPRRGLIFHPGKLKQPSGHVGKLKISVEEN